MQAEAKEFLHTYLQGFAKLEKKQTLAYWVAANSGKKEDFDAFAEADIGNEYQDMNYQSGDNRETNREFAILFQKTAIRFKI